MENLVKMSTSKSESWLDFLTFFQIDDISSLDVASMDRERKFKVLKLTTSLLKRGQLKINFYL